MSAAVAAPSEQQSAPALLLDHPGGAGGSGGATGTSSAATTAAAGAGAGAGGAGGDASAPVTRVVVHPLVLFHVLDHHTRRQAANSRVIGTLLGRRDGNLCEVTNCFAVPHAERGDEVAIGKDFNKTMLALHMRTNRREAVVGWYATTSAPVGEDLGGGDGVLAEATTLIPDTSSLIHEFYAGESDGGDPIHLVVDTSLSSSSSSSSSSGGDALPIRAYKNVPILIRDEQLGNLFHELQLPLKSDEPETICLNEMIVHDIRNNAGENGNEDGAAAMAAAGALSSPSSVDALQVSMERLHGLLESTLAYVDGVVDGSVARPSDEVGRSIADTLATLPRLRPEIFDKIFHDSLQDLLMVTYLSNLTRTQVTIAEKLNASLGGV